ncbi:MAG: tyrosine-protein phosphatase, partial [Sphingobium sp.]
TAQSKTRIGDMRRQMPDAIAPVLTADAAYIDMLFQTLDAEPGGIDGYLADSLSVDAAKRDAIRELLLEP